MLDLGRPGERLLRKSDAVLRILRELGGGWRMTGATFSRGTWHTTARYPLHPPATVFAVISDHETAADPTLSQEVDYHERYGLTFRVTPAPATRPRSRRRSAGRPGGVR